MSPTRCVKCPTGRLLLGALLAAIADLCPADELLFRYEADVHPAVVASGSNPCEPPTCLDSVENGHYVIRWPSGGGDRFAHGFDVARFPAPPPPSLWAEWRFRSNRPMSPFCFNCDGQFLVQYRGTDEIVNMYGDTTVDESGGIYVTSHSLNEFRTYRYESADGTHFRISVDGFVYYERDEFNNFVTHVVSLRGRGGSSADAIPNAENAWDFVRYGTLSSGERLVSSDPASGFVDPQQYPGLDRFVVTFDTPCYVYPADITVQVTGGGPAPVVTKTRRLDNDEPTRLEIFVEPPMPLGETTTFILDTGLTPPETNTVSFTLAPAPIIPATSHWGLLVLTLLGLTAGTMIARASLRHLR